jgi:SMP-30/Gluconolactonase/LRE-like region
LAACPVQVQEIVEFPTINITSCAFGGPQLNILYVTTAMPDLAGQTGLEWGLLESAAPGVSLLTWISDAGSTPAASTTKSLIVKELCQYISVRDGNLAYFSSTV